jgi:hypothetical protein
MNILKMIAELREELVRIEEAVIILEKLSHTETARRGRPPLWSRAAGVITPPSRNGQNAPLNGAAFVAPQG